MLFNETRQYNSQFFIKRINQNSCYFFPIYRSSPLFNCLKILLVSETCKVNLMMNEMYIFSNNSLFETQSVFIRV